MDPTTLLSTVADLDDVEVTLDGRTWTVSPVEGVVLVRDADADYAPAISIRRAWLADSATLADVVRLALVEAAPRSAVLSAVAAALLAGRVLLAPRVSCGRIHSATDPTPRWGCYRDPGGELVVGDHAIPACEIGWHGGIETTHTYEPDTSPFGAAQAFLHEVGITGARAALERHPDGCGACDPEAACPDCADAYGRLDAVEGDAGLADGAAP